VTRAALAVLLVGCYASHGRPLPGRDAGVRDAPRLDVGPLPSCDELFARVPDRVIDGVLHDVTCGPTTFPLAQSFLQGEPRALRSCFRVLETFEGSGWRAGDVVSVDGPFLALRVAGPPPPDGPQQVLWQVRQIDEAGSIVEAMRATLLIERPPLTAYGGTVLGLGSILPSIWASPGQFNVGLYGYLTDAGEETVRASHRGATFVVPGPPAAFHWVHPDDTDHEVALPASVGTSPLVADWGDARDQHWIVAGSDGAVHLRQGPSGLELVGPVALSAAPTAIAVHASDLYYQSGDEVVVAGLDGTVRDRIGGVRALLPSAIVRTEGRVEPFEGPSFDVRPTDLDAAGQLVDVTAELMVVGDRGVAASSDLPGPTFVPWTQLGRAPLLARVPGSLVSGGADVLFEDRASAMRVELSFRACD
jgi:hypothetical protein